MLLGTITWMKQEPEARDLTRLHLEFDLPDHVLPEFPAAHLPDNSSRSRRLPKGKLVTIDNFHELFNAILNPKQIERFRLLLTPLAQQQCNPNR